MCPSPIVGPQPQTGSSATSRRPGERRPSPGTGRCRPGSRRSATPPRRSRSPARSARTARAAASAAHATTEKWTRSIVSRSPGSTSSTGPRPSFAGEPAEPARDDDRGLAGDLAQGRRVEVVVVAVADEHGVEVREQLRQHRPHLAPDGTQALAQHRVGEDPQVVDLDQDRRVAEERDAPVLGAGGIRRSRRRGRRARPGRRRRGGAAWRHGAANCRSCSPRGEGPRRWGPRQRPCRTARGSRSFRDPGAAATGPIACSFAVRRGANLPMASQVPVLPVPSPSPPGVRVACATRKDADTDESALGVPRRQRGGRARRVRDERGDLDLPDHAGLADGRVLRRLVGRAASRTCGARCPRSSRCSPRPARPARCTGRCRRAR